MTILPFSFSVGVAGAISAIPRFYGPKEKPIIILNDRQHCPYCHCIQWKGLESMNKETVMFLLTLAISSSL
uniref:Uncharacterized protein n=1 Tax=Nelumbo nucifera TaxID=4432 RepID=A0A822XZR1_NELNU|nr:TPA_asm: hypothetical protein HUJ06_025731 [Nelumbo nucifera]